MGRYRSNLKRSADLKSWRHKATVPRRTFHEPHVDFSTFDAPLDKSRLFFAVLAYPELNAGAVAGSAGRRFSEALLEYFLWGLRQQYGLAALRERGLKTASQEDWAKTLRRGGARIRRRLQVQRFWAKRGVWVSEHSGISASLLETLKSQRLNVRRALLRDPAHWHRAFRLDRHRDTRDEQSDDLISDLRAAISESKPVLHMAWQLRERSFSQAAADHRPIPAHEKLSWRQAFLRSPEWIEEAIGTAEAWRRHQNPLRPNDLASEDLIELRL